MAKGATLAHKSVRYFATNFKVLRSSPSLFWTRKVGRFELAREISKRTSSVPPEPPLLSTSVGQITADAGLGGALNVLDLEGYYVGLRLSQDTLQSLLQRTEVAPCFANRDPKRPFRFAEHKEAEQRYECVIKQASYFDQQEAWPEFERLRRDPFLLALARSYLKCEPYYVQSELLWSFPCAQSAEDRLKNAQVFHCDINDIRTLKVFFYLTDVDEGCGPHTYIKKNPRARTLAHQILGQRVASIPDETLQRIYAQNQVVTVSGPAGLGFAGDPYYFHRGNAPTTRRRLLLQIELGSQRYRDFRVANSNGEPQ